MDLDLYLHDRRPFPFLTGFRHFWMKRVRGVNLDHHCIRCLRGPLVRVVHPRDFPAGRIVHVETVEGEVLYLCGVAEPRRWANNAHLAMRVVAGASCELPLYTGARILVRNAERIPFDGTAAAEAYPDRGPEFLTCRNFQFAVQFSRSAG